MNTSFAYISGLTAALFLTFLTANAQLFESPQPITKRNVLPQMIAHADLDGDGLEDIVGVQRNQIRTMRNLGTGTFSNQLGFASDAMDNFLDIRILDYNADGLPDVLCYTETSVKVFVNNGDLSFSFATSIAKSLSGVNRIEVLDINNDGYDDIVIFEGSIVNLYVNNQGVGFGAAQATDVADNLPGINIDILRMATGDFNGDGLVDLATVSPAQVLVFLNDGAGAFEAPTLAATVASTFPFPEKVSIVVADFNQDGILDISYLSTGFQTFFESSFSRVFLLLNDGIDGQGEVQFIQSTLYNQISNQNYGDLLAGDVNGNGLIDIVATGHTFDIDIFFEDGDGEFWNAFNAVRLLSNNGSMGFSNSLLLFESLRNADAVPLVTKHGLMTDLDGDGLSELVFPGSRVASPGSSFDVAPFDIPGVPYYFQNTGGFQNFSASAMELTPASSENVRDWFMPRSSTGVPGHVFTHGTTLHNDVVVRYELNQNNGFDPSIQLVLPKVKNRSFQSINFNNDAFPDLLVSVLHTPASALSGVPLVAIYSGNAQGGYDLAYSTSDDLYGALNSVAVDDLNGDGYDDIALASISNGQLFTLTNDQNQQFTSSVLHQYENGSYARSMKFFQASPGDDPELVVLAGAGLGEFSSDASIERFQNVAGQLQLPSSIMLPGIYKDVRRLEVADTNNDDIPDFMVGGASAPFVEFDFYYNPVSDKIGLFTSNGIGGYSGQAVVQKHRKDFFAMGDVDGNGNPDFVYVSAPHVSIPNPGFTHLRVNNGQGLFNTNFNILSAGPTAFLSDKFGLATLSSSSVPDLLGLGKNPNTGLQELYYMRNVIVPTMPHVPHVFDGSGIGLFSELDVEVYPNPSFTDVNVVLPAGDFELLVYDLWGRKLYQAYAEGTHLLIPHGKLPKGTYMLHLQHGGQHTARRLVIL